MTQIYQAIASKIVAMRNCNASGNGEWFTRHHDAIDNIIREHMPSGSGFDAGTTFDVCAHVDANADQLTFGVEFHHMDENGSYSRWTSHTVIVTPSLAHGINLRVTGRDFNGIKDYIADTYHAALTRELEV